MERKLFTPFSLRNIEFKNRIIVSPMCQYSAEEGVPNEWHLVHLGSRAIGGAGLVFTEATAVESIGRISPYDTGIWNEKQIKAFKRITSFISRNGSVPGIQLAHAGRKASTNAPWHSGNPIKNDEGGWDPVAPSKIPFDKNYPSPQELSISDIDDLIFKFQNAARNAFEAGFKVVEIHMAHGYLLHEFLSPLSNNRKDEFGGNLEGRMKFPLKVAESVRKEFPDILPVFVRLSVTDWVDGGLDLKESITLCKELKKAGIDLIDCSSGGLVPDAKILSGSGFQVPFSSAIRKLSEIPTGAVGFITTPEQAEQTLICNEADMIIIAREMLRDPYWPLHAAKKLGVDIKWPVQYERAKV